MFNSFNFLNTDILVMAKCTFCTKFDWFFSFNNYVTPCNLYIHPTHICIKSGFSFFYSNISFDWLHGNIYRATERATEQACLLACSLACSVNLPCKQSEFMLATQSYELKWVNKLISLIFFFSPILHTIKCVIVWNFIIFMKIQIIVGFWFKKNALSPTHPLDNVESYRWQISNFGFCCLLVCLLVCLPVWLPACLHDRKN